jgi:hypothetical protein
LGRGQEHAEYAGDQKREGDQEKSRKDRDLGWDRRESSYSGFTSPSDTEKDQERSAKETAQRDGHAEDHQHNRRQ